MTTGLLTAVGYVKDNRFCRTASTRRRPRPKLRCTATAATDPDSTVRGHRLRYSVDSGPAAGPFEVEAELLYQPIGYRWAKNLAVYDAPEPRRFSGFFAAMAPASATLLAKARAVTP